MFIYSKYLFLSVFIISLSSCSHKQVVGDLILQDHIISKPKEQFIFSDVQSLRKQIREIGPLDKRENQKKIIRILLAYQGLTNNLKEDKLKFLPQTATNLRLTSFCASPYKSIPEANETYKWAKGNIDVPLIRPVLKLYSHSPANKQTTIQELL